MAAIIEKLDGNGNGWVLMDDCMLTDAERSTQLEQVSEIINRFWYEEWMANTGENDLRDC